MGDTGIDIITAEFLHKQAANGPTIFMMSRGVTCGHRKTDYLLLLALKALEIRG
jgi:hypothetical protein